MISNLPHKQTNERIVPFRISQMDFGNMGGKKKQIYIFLWEIKNKKSIQTYSLIVSILEVNDKYK